jgi:hypothetical protein
MSPRTHFAAAPFQMRPAALGFDLSLVRSERRKINLKNLKKAVDKSESF